MYNIRIKQLPKNGDQRNYSLVDRNDLYIKVNPINQDSNVKNTISAVPREEANIEAEGGETVIGDINNDGFLEHNKIVGKRHTEGGVPLNVAPGSFIFSDTKKLKIKDPEVLSIFGITNIPKGGITPAKIANKYPMNNYMNTLKDDTTDPISKRSASKMLENSLEKLGMLALVQESMKGFPDGVPAIAESVMAGMQGPEMQGAPQEMIEGQESSGQEMQMRYGGSAYYQVGSTTTEPQTKKLSGKKKIEPKPYIPTNTYKVGPDASKGYIDRVIDANIFRSDSRDEVDPRMYIAAQKLNPFSDKVKGVGDYFGNLLSMPQKEVNNLLTGYYESPMDTKSRYSEVSDSKHFWGDVATDPMMYPELPIMLGKGAVKLTGKAVQKVVPYAKEIAQLTAKYGSQAAKFLAQYIGKMPFEQLLSKGYLVANRIGQAGMHAVGDDTKDQSYDRIIPAKINGKDGQIGRSNGKWYDTYTGKEVKNIGTYAPNQNMFVNPIQEATPIDTTTVEQDRTQRVVIKEDNAGAARRRAQKAPVNVAPKNINKAPATSSGISVEYTNDFEYGGSLPEHQGTNQGVPSTVQPPKEKTIVKWQVSNTTGKKRPVYSDGTIGEPIEYNVADEDLRALVGAKGYDFVDLPEDLKYKQKTVGPQTAKTGFILDPESGFRYHPDPEVGAPKPGTRGLEEYMKIHADAINAYPGGATKWRQDQIAGKGNANPAMTHVLQYQNAAIGTVSGNRPYVDMSIEGALIPGVENYNLPGIRKKAPAVTPGTQQTVVKKDIVVPQIQNQPVAKRRRPWWLQDQVNFAGAMTDMVDKYGPAMAQFDLETPGYALEDPARQIAAMQENSAANREALMNTTAGNVAGASMASQSPTDLANVANVIGNVQNRNVGTYNQVSNIGAQINNQEQTLNENAEQKYIADSATANQQYANAMRDLKWNRIKAFNQGTSNFQRTNQLESMFPQTGFDRMTGDIAFAGGREAYDENGNPLYDTYVNPFGSTDKSLDSNSGYLTGAQLAALKADYIKSGLTEEQAMEVIKQQTGRSSSNSRSQNSVANAVVSGQTLPQQGARYGGYMKQYGGTVFDFGALPLYFFED